jgi:meso-butanediol dehydrogenase/(S,S)-butanediol dehydrogenase/diacetyl reductase
MLFQNKVVIITGAAGGIGLATAHRFASEGAKLVLIDLNEEALSKTESQIKQARATDILCISTNVASENEVAASAEKTMKTFGQIDAIVNNAGRMLFKPIEQQTTEDWDNILKVDLYGAFFYIKYGFLHMKPGSSIVNVSSIHALETEPMVAPYAAAKAALLSLTRSAALEGKPKGIRVNAVLPGAIDTPMLWNNPNVKAGIEIINKEDVGRPEDIANSILYLSSENAGFIQGASLKVDGGRLARL